MSTALTKFQQRMERTSSLGETLSFKRVIIGDTFEHNGTRYRKVGKLVAFRIKPSGVGETHARLPFSRSTKVVLVA